MLLELAGVAIIAFVASLFVCRAMIAAGPLDLPTEAHKPHKAPTPTSGGVGIATGFAVAMLALFVFSFAWRDQVSEQGLRLLLTTALFAYPLLLIGIVDDARRLDAKVKFILFASLSLAAAWTAGVVDTLPFGDGILRLPYPVALVGTALWVFTLVNVVNFMDGANGLAMGTTAVGLAALAAIALERGSPAGAALAICGAGALLGFLVWNYPFGRLFAGDSGALFAGAIAAFGSLIVIARTDLSPFIPPILFFPLLADALLTLFFRARHGKSLFVGHAEHVYQLASVAGVRAVAILYWLMAALCGVVGFAAAMDESGASALLALAALAAVSITLDLMVRRWALRKGVLQA